MFDFHHYILLGCYQSKQKDIPLIAHNLEKLRT
jgi:hypothetical protein